MLLAAHLRYEWSVHDLVELFPAGAARHFGGEGLGVRKHLTYVGITADHDLRRLPSPDDVERAAPRPPGDVLVRVRLELGAARIELDHVVGINLRKLGPRWA